MRRLNLLLETGYLNLQLPLLLREFLHDFIKFLIYSLSSNDETVDHLETLFETESLKNDILYNSLHSKLEHLGKKLNNFIQAVERNHNEFQS